ncbi:hypothetical protein A3D85_02270 [Candidatus Amesbacteria bacterium RIFCSPHIGHO2_02_FULL_47_9]|uniref:SH3b domain-containing protein n=1 Tax=Candidatus Amesbacteria bacterium RIFCSPHIGHO2_01_FULL_48_32b TaxID=1797253 RepID=A0A1F4YH70_9BACT|nr:MAG: hypothetical protein A2876_00925 [Candidatus Amesbacteria bacterium RIFCSPHIGHO2_01_FULL_48_32b]OGD02880.1 MAG: hypothetical protein A3D85_02270 [Candidatus Amesbacteria bacterium RIFCSPHIGHO2_02_FULL_47_9]OGD07420.1 MAG: hypothetical protein A2899_03910 [Candidatus Amesbacteria bacterium RIFCSPLOWO2_01_FULL_49_25]
MELNKKVIAIILVISGLLIAGSFGIYRYYHAIQADAGLKVESTPPSQVFINNQLVGNTPIDKVLPAGEVTIKLIPDSTSSAISAYQTKIQLTPQTYTVIKRDFGDSDSLTAGETVSLLPQSTGKTSLSIVTSYPVSASVTVDDQPQGFTPLSLADIAPGDRKIVISAPGYSSRVIYVKAVTGYKLAVSAKLKESPLAKLDLFPRPSPVLATASASLESPDSFVTVLDTPTGFLRVRSGPGLNKSEIGQIKPGEKYPLLSASSDWYQIQVKLESTSSGWISSQYAAKK